MRAARDVERECGCSGHVGGGRGGYHCRRGRGRRSRGSCLQRLLYMRRRKQYSPCRSITANLRAATPCCSSSGCGRGSGCGARGYDSLRRSSMRHPPPLQVVVLCIERRRAVRRCMVRVSAQCCAGGWKWQVAGTQIGKGRSSELMDGHTCNVDQASHEISSGVQCTVVTPLRTHCSLHALVYWMPPALFRGDFGTCRMEVSAS